MIIKYDGTDYPFDFDEVTVKQGVKIEKFMGCSFEEWGTKLQAGDLRARQALGWVILHGGDLTVPIEDTDFKMAKLGAALIAAFEADAPAGAEPVPTGAVASTGQTPAAAALSPVSLPPSSGEISR